MRWNFCGLIIGPPEYGKTTVARHLVRRHLATTNGIAFVHDPVQQFGRDGCYFYEDVAAWRRAAFEATKTKRPMSRGISLGGSTEEIVELAGSLGVRAGNTQEHVRVPILVVMDEGSTNENSGATWMGREDMQALSMRRHRGVGFAFNIQEPTMLTEKFYLFATDFYLFAQTTDHARMLDKRLLLEKGTLERAGVCSLPMRKYLHARKVVGVVGDAL